LKDEQKRYFSQKLQEEKKLLIKQMDYLGKTGLNSTLGESIGELSVCDNHPADIGDELFERSKDIALRDNAHIILERVEYALQRLGRGTYECCDKCGQKIPLERLEAIPWASECVSCQRREDDADHAGRPIEEELLTPPFERNFLDNDPIDFVGFDGEDALQAVMRYGSSDTPQDIPGTHDYKDLFLGSDEEEGIVDPADAIPNASDGVLVREHKKY